MARATTNLRRFALSLLVLPCAILAASGCAMGGGTIGTGYGSSFGGGTSGTGLPLGATPTPNEEGVSYFNLRGTVLDAKGKPASGIVVTVETARQKDTSTTDDQGQFDISAAAAAGDELRIFFHSGSINAKHTVKKLPADINEAEFRFKLTGNRVTVLRQQISKGE